MEPIFWWVLTGVLGVACMIGLWAALKVRMTYHIGRTSLRIKVLGFTVRRISLDDIERVDKPRRDLRWVETEYWCNTFDTAHRLLVVHRRSGFFRRIAITPIHRYEFRRSLRLAAAEASGESTESIEATEPESATDAEEKADSKRESVSM
jgi:hypothetical protein